MYKTKKYKTQAADDQDQIYSLLRNKDLVIGTY